MNQIGRWYSKIGSKGGKSRSPAKIRAAQRNGRLAQRPHIRKTRYFVKAFRHALIDNEWQVKWPIGPGKTTYNPDFHCPTLKCFIELVKSKPNLADVRPKWRRAIKLGYPLRLFWWQGQEITNPETFNPSDIPHDRRKARRKAKCSE